MPSIPASLELPAGLALAVVLGCMVLALLISRALGRKGRGRERDERRALLRRLRALARGEATPASVARLARAVDVDSYWAAVERGAVGLSRAERRRLSLALATNPHARAERLRLRDESPWRRELAARRLGLLGSPATRRALRKALQGGPELVTLAAAMALARDGDLAALRWVLRHPQSLAHRPRSSVRVLLQSFGRRGLPEIAAALEQGIDAPTLELAAIDVVGRGGYRGSRDRLERMLASGTLEQRLAAARALGGLQAVECAGGLLAALRDSEWEVRAQAARALGRVRAPIAIPALSGRLTDPSWWVRRHAAYALGELGAEGQEALRRIATTSVDPYARDMAREVLEGGIRFDVA